jgi:hypothetical protein
MPIPSVEQFFALARSSPWRWSTLRFRVTWRGRMHTSAAGFRREPVRAWVARPDALRIETHDGRVLIAGRRPESPDLPPLMVENLTEVDHHGRPVWEAVVRPTDTYDPRCACCALLFGAKSEAIVADLGGPTLSDRDPSVRYADAVRVRVDSQTGVCVLTVEIGGSAPGSGHELVIEAVDEQLPDELFRPSPHSRWLLRKRR